LQYDLEWHCQFFFIFIFFFLKKGSQRNLLKA
jgi:hypothetical protein